MRRLALVAFAILLFLPSVGSQEPPDAWPCDPDCPVPFWDDKGQCSPACPPYDYGSERHREYLRLWAEAAAEEEKRVGEKTKADR